IDEALGGTGAHCVWVGTDLIEKRTRAVGVGAGEGDSKDAIKRQLEKIGFRLDWLLVTGIRAARDVEKSGMWFTQLGGVVDGAPGADGRTALALHLPEFKPEQLVAFWARWGGTIAWDRIRLEAFSGDTGVGGMKLQRALRGLPGVRLGTSGAKADRFEVEVEM